MHSALIAFLLYSAALTADSTESDVASIKEKYQGPTIPVLTHYLDDQKTIDVKTIEDNVEQVIRRGIQTGDGVLLAGASGGDFPRLSSSQRKEVISTIVSVSRGRVPVIASVQHSDVDKILELAAFAEEAGADALQISPPYYYPASFEDFNRTLAAVFAATKKIPLMIYNTPWEYNPPTGSSMDLSEPMIQQLVDTWPRFLILKWSSSNSNTYQKVLYKFSDRLAIIDNYGLQALNYMLGGTGFITHFANIWPEWNVKVHRLLKAEKYREAQKEIAEVYWPWSEFRGKIFARTALESPVVKGALDLLEGRRGGAVAKPNRRLNEEEMTELYAILKKVGVPNLRMDGRTAELQV